MSERLPDPWPAPLATGPVRATVSLPGSKSLTNRALLLGALAEGPSVVRGALRSRDTTLMAAALTALGSAVDTRGVDWTVTPGVFDRAAEIDCGLAGTVARFVPPAAALSSASVAFDGDPHMRARPVGEVVTALRALGVEVDDGGRGALPFTVRGGGRVRGGEVVVDASSSSQFVSALLLAGARYERGVDVRHEGPPMPSAPHVEMTVDMLRRHGVAVDDATPDRWTVAPGPLAAVDHAVEPDLSNAGPFLALAAVTGGSVTVTDWPERTTQAGDALRGVLTAMGCTVERTAEGLRVTGPDELRGVDLDLHEVGELAPVVAATCARAGSPSRLRGIAHVRGHETDRLAALARELGALGADVTEHPDGLELRPARLHGGVFHTYGDHRMAHAGVVVGAVVPDVAVEQVTTTAKTYPGFAKVWAALFAGPVA